MTRAVQAAGGQSRILACGTVMTEGFQVPMLAWNLDVHTGRIQASPTEAGERHPAERDLPDARAAQRPPAADHRRLARHASYTRVTHVRTFRVYAQCANGASL